MVKMNNFFFRDKVYYQRHSTKSGRAHRETVRSKAETHTLRARVWATPLGEEEPKTNDFSSTQKY